MIRVVLCSGAFDGLHAGHVEYFAAAKLLCEENEVLVCAVAPDRYIEQEKGRAPFWPQADRLITVRALLDVDAAIAQSEVSVARIIRCHRPRLFVKGLDWVDRLPDDVLQACEECGTRMVFVDTEGIHSSDAMGARICPTT